MQYHLVVKARHPPADFDLMAVRVFEGVLATFLIFALGALAVWLVVRLYAERSDPQPPRKARAGARTSDTNVIRRR